MGREKTMSEYIKREDALQAIADFIKSGKSTRAIAEVVLADVPDADVRPVVFCKDCEYSRFCAQYIEVHGKYYHIDYCSGSEHSKVKK